ncbi:MAG: hypothetical protein PHG06_00390 [Parabacteroides sp.]|nr:hypothetical protein [Parabacteroides sp.]
MIRIINFRLVIEKFDTHEKYYPRVVSFDTIDSYPLTDAPSATIKMISTSNLDDVSTVSQVEFDDIVRLQASARYNVLEKNVWVNIFEGRVQNQSKEYGENNEIELSCVGHIIEAYNKSIHVDFTYNNVDASILLQAMAANTVRIDYNASYVQTALAVTEFNQVAKQNFVIDTYKEIEKLSGYRQMIDVVPVYSSAGNLQVCYTRWRNFSSTPTKQYAVIAGTPRLISASFDIVGEEVYNYRYIQGGEDTNGVQCEGSAYNTDSVKLYGTRDKIDTFSWIKTNQLCNAIAAGLVIDSGVPYVAGQAVLEGTIDAHIGDLVNVKIASLEVNGVEINGYYTVYRVAHSFSGEQFTTTLDLGRIKKNEYDYISMSLTQILKTCYKNQSKLK